MMSLKPVMSTVVPFLLLALTACNLKESGYASPSFQVSTVNSVLVLPRSATKFDVQIAARVQQNLSAAGITTVDVSKMTPLAQLTAADACRQGETLDFQVVVFADWNSLTMVDCKSLLTTFNRSGSDVNAQGVDSYTRALVKYLKGQPQE
jgi:hypothetical protein